MEKANGTIRIILLWHLSNQHQMMNESSGVTSCHITCVNKLENVSVLANEIDESLHWFHTAGSHATTVARFRNRRVSHGEF
jgi:hypothetical protein